MYNRRYDKVFLMLRQETAGYSMGQRAPWGSCIMEIKNGTGRISLTVQGLRPIHRGRYAVYAIAGEKEKQNNFFCGVLTPDSGGHGELKWDFNPDGLGGKNITAEELNTVAILAEADGGFSAPLAAYFSGKTDWRTYFNKAAMKKGAQKEPTNIQLQNLNQPVKKELKVEKPVEEPALVAAEATVVEMPSFEMPKINLKKDGAKEENLKPKEEKKESFHGSFRGLLEKFRQELDELQDTGVFTDKDLDRIARAGRRNFQKEAVMQTAVEEPSTVKQATIVEESPIVEQATVVEEPSIVEQVTTVEQADAVEGSELNLDDSVEKASAIEEEDLNEVKENFLERYRMLKENTDIFPFGEEVMPWKCISIEEMILLEDIPLSWMKDYFILFAMKKYHHLIWKPQKNGYLLGAPGVDTDQERAKAEELGFQEFRKMEDGDLGYWIFTKK
ncbi:DUF7922 domain-containing protein [Anaerotignum sp.]|uniref:DUF7922 domain-containing protein n=1 Tax=Anaerotignum sp. TaxID=2039241 RepID=UPI002714BF35|nr:hypothetical protein [Anaerotignum sp.]